MEMFGIGYMILSLSLFILSIGIIFGVPMTWFHVGHISRKMSKLMDSTAQTNKILGELLEEKKKDHPIKN